MRTCKKCNEIKEDTEFKWMTGTGCGAGYYRGTCNSCMKTYRKNAPSNKKHQTPEEQRKRYLKAKYGINVEEYDRLYESQDGKCSICGTENKENRRHLSVDHCHTTGKIRGLLCQSCNKGLGLFRDKIEFLRKAAEYLEKI